MAEMIRKEGLSLKTGTQCFLAETASDAAYPSGVRFSWHVPVDQLLGFCDLFCSDRWSCLIANIIRFEGKIIRILAVTIVQAVEIIGLSYLVILPFTLKFDTMVQGWHWHSIIHCGISF